MNNTVGVSMKDAMHECTLVVTRAKELSVRLWVATQLIRLAAWVAWMDIEFKEK